MDISFYSWHLWSIHIVTKSSSWRESVNLREALVQPSDGGIHLNIHVTGKEFWEAHWPWPTFVANNHGVNSTNTMMSNQAANAHPCRASAAHCDWTWSDTNDSVAAERLRSEESVAARRLHRFSLVSCWRWVSGERFRKGSSSSLPFSFRTLLLRSRQHWGQEGRKTAVFSLKSGLFMLPC